MPPPLGTEAARSPRPKLALRLRGLVRLRRRFGWLLALAPVLTVVGFDLATRGERLVALPAKYLGSYSLAIVESAILWASLMIAASARRGVSRFVAGALFVLLFTAAIGGQLYFYSQYSTYLNLDATLFGTSFAGSVFGQLSADGPNFLWNVGPAFVIAIVLAFSAAKLLRPRRRTLRVARVFAPVALVAVFLIPVSYRSVQASTPDVIYFHALGGLIKELTGVRSTAQIRPGLRSCPAMPTLSPRPPTQRNVILLLTESVRADTHCSAFEASCPNAPRTNAAVPDRLPLLQLRSNSTTTAIQLAVMWSGLEPVESRERLHSVPLLFDYAHAAGMHTAYWTSHHMMFANSRLWVQDLPTRFQCGATDLEPTADIDVGGDDALLVERALSELPKLEEPFFAVVHVGNTHVPYKVDPADSPFQPSFASKAPEDNEAYRNFYKNAVHLQDKAIGRFLEEIGKTSYGARTVVLFTSDHGEAFREHDQLGHTGSLYEEELHVPGWVHAPPGVLTEAERHNLAARRELPTFHTDVTPTVLDLLGLWDDPELEPFKLGIVGQSWIRPPEPPIPLALTNCSGVWGCAFRNWGVMRGFLKLHAREWDSKWRCFDVRTDPLEKNDLGPEGCGDLVKIAERVHDGFPGGN
ncbi:MAG: sulfatase-like hydrolase/transferase [Polyangiaceae bacterium]|nr:sulfatase-like hydrolase/transferase [Polyangiaceae bacterium]